MKKVLKLAFHGVSRVGSVIALVCSLMVRPDYHPDMPSEIRRIESESNSSGGGWG